MNKTIGVILIVIGLVGLLYGGFSYTKRDKILDIGPIQATKEETKTIPLPPIAGAVALIGGVLLLARRQA
jgi:nitrate reductase gamma subunit